MLRNLKMEKDDNGDPFTPYSLRHTWATLKLNAGMDMRLVALNMGTSPEMIHRHYGHDNIRHPFLDDTAEIGLLPHLQALLLARHIRGDLDGYPPLIWG